jgi:hypothetical protein
MQLLAILKARALARIDVDEFNLRGRVRFADIISPIVERYGFLTYPAKLEDFDLEKGVKFGSGRWENQVVESLTIFNGLIFLETLSSTEHSRACLLEMLSWAGSELGLTYKSGMINRWAYISQVTFSTDFPLLSALSPPLARLGKKTTEVIESLFEEGLTYEPAFVTVGHDPLARKHAIAGFTIQPRQNLQFGDHKFFPRPLCPQMRMSDFLKSSKRTY